MSKGKYYHIKLVISNIEDAEAIVPLSDAIGLRVLLNKTQLYYASDTLLDLATKERRNDIKKNKA